MALKRAVHSEEQRLAGAADAVRARIAHQSRAMSTAAFTQVRSILTDDARAAAELAALREEEGELRASMQRSLEELRESRAEGGTLARLIDETLAQIAALR